MLDFDIPYSVEQIEEAKYAMLKANGWTDAYVRAVAFRGAGLRTAGSLKPGVLVGRVVDHQLGNDAKPASVGFVEEKPEIVQRSQFGMDGLVATFLASDGPGRTGFARL